MAQLPDRPGVYLFKDRRGRALYIGKARSLRARVAQYAAPPAGADDPRLARMIAQIHDVDILETPSEVEALLAEARLIKDIHPRYNVRLRDDKSFVMLEITATDDFPKVRVVHETDPAYGERIGPFTSSAELREGVRILQRVFRFATCELEIREGDPRLRFFRPCLLAAIDRCTAPCAARISKQDYAKSIEAFRRFVLGDREGVMAQIEREMHRAAARREYERAAELRDQARALRALGKRGAAPEFIEGDITPIQPAECLDDLRVALGWARPPRRIEGVDIATLGGGQAVGSLVCFADGVPQKGGYRRYRIRTVRGMDDFAMIREVVGRRARRLRQEGREPPDVLLIDGGVGQLNAAAEALGQVRPRALMALAKREETVFLHGRDGALPLERHRPALRLLMYVRDEAHRFAQHYHHILRRKAVLEGQA